MTTMSITQTFTRTNARYLASKVAADLYQCASFYGRPDSASIANYLEELVELLLHGYIDKYEFGFEKNGYRVVSWRYTANAIGDLVGGDGDQRAGGIYARAAVTGSVYYNILSYSSNFCFLTEQRKSAFLSNLPICRVTGNTPLDGNGYWVSDRNYSNSGTSLSRRTFRPI